MSHSWLRRFRILVRQEMRKPFRIVLFAGLILSALFFSYYYGIFLPRRSRAQIEQTKQNELAKEQARLEQEKQEHLAQEQAQKKQEHIANEKARAEKEKK